MGLKDFQSLIDLGDHSLLDSRGLMLACLGWHFLKSFSLSVLLLQTCCSNLGKLGAKQGEVGNCRSMEMGEA
jgi:hypothetical protein